MKEMGAVAGREERANVTSNRAGFWMVMGGVVVIGLWATAATYGWHGRVGATLMRTVMAVSCATMIIGLAMVRRHL